MQKNNNLQKKSNNNFFLITFLLTIGAIILTWTPWSTNQVGIINVLQCIYQTASDFLASGALSIFAFAFFLYAVLRSQAFQALFTSKQKWLQKRKYFTIGLITVAAALLSSNLSWFDEFIHFYPLVIPLLAAMGFDFFSSILCLYGGSIAGLIGSVSSERMNRHFTQSFGSEAKSLKYTGITGISFRLVSFILFVSIVILFNIWYCSRNRQNSTSEPTNNLVQDEVSPPFNRARKIVLVIAGFFLAITIGAQIPKVANALKTESLTERIPSWLSSEYEEKEYKEVGEIGGIEMAKVNKVKHSYWGKFGEWEDMALDCWLILGGILICLFSEQSIIENLTTAMQKTIPIVLVYIFAAVPVTIINNSGITKSLAKKILPTTVTPYFKYLVLFSVFGLTCLLTFFLFSSKLSAGIVAAIAPALLANSESTLIHGAIFGWAGAMIGLAFSPYNGVLMASLEKGKMTYKQFIKKTWILGLIMFLTMLGLVYYWTAFNIN